MPASNGATSWHSESRQATHCAWASVSERRQRDFCDDSKPWRASIDLIAASTAAASCRSDLSAFGPQALGKLAGADLGGVADGLRRARVFGSRRRAQGDRGCGKHEGSHDQVRHPKKDRKERVTSSPPRAPGG